ncbi:DUF4174 domain-containing protein [Celeribacter sp. ULVN23_4]
MKHFYLAAITALFLIPSPLLAQEEIPSDPLIQSADDIELSAFKWKNRVIAVFADSTLDPSYNEQLSLLEERPDPLLERDVVIFTDTDPDARSPLRTELRPRGFALVIVDKDGRVMLRKPDPWDVREITRAIDKTPLRQQEMQSGR